MRRVVIADDESLIRKGIKTIIPWDEYGFEIVGEASNGTEALSITKKERADVLITDVKMPDKSGIEVLKQIHALNMNTKVVLISGYNDFAFVKEGMVYGAVNYILKPVSKEELISTVKEIAAVFDNQIYTNIQQRKNMTVLKNNTLLRLVKNQIATTDLLEKLNILHIDLSEKRMRVAVIELDLDEDDNSSKSWKSYASLNICEELIEQSLNGIVFFDYGSHIIIIFTKCSDDAADQNIKNILDSCLENIRKCVDVQIVAAVGTLASSYSQLHTSFKKAVACLDFQFIFGKSKTLFSDEITQYYEKKASDVHPDLEYIRNILKAKNVEPVTDYIGQFFSSLQKNEIIVNEYVIKNFALEVLITIYYTLKDYTDNESDLQKIKGSTLMRIEKARDLDDLIQIEKECAQQMVMVAYNKECTKFSKPINDIINFMEKNYMDKELSLQLLSDRMYINTAYLGRMFKHETGQYFTDFLTSIRIKKAIQLLRETNDRIIEISDKVGFSNYSYFYTIFKKTTGISPKEYRS